MKMFEQLKIKFADNKSLLTFVTPFTMSGVES